MKKFILCLILTVMSIFVSAESNEEAAKHFASVMSENYSCEIVSVVSPFVTNYYEIDMKCPQDFLDKNDTIYSTIADVMNNYHYVTAHHMDNDEMIRLAYFYHNKVIFYIYDKNENMLTIISCNK